MSIGGQLLRKTSIIATAVLLMGVGIAQAMPPYQGDPTEEGFSAKKRSIDEAYAQLQSEWIKRGVDAPTDIDFQAWLSSTASTSKNMLCILIKFPDKANITNASYFDTLVFVNQVGSVRHYYNEVSYSQLDIVTVNLPSALGWVTAANNVSYYTNSAYGTGSYPQNCQKLVEEVIDLVDGAVDFSNYDNDGDGYVDGLIVVHSGRGAELTASPHDIWSHKWTTFVPRLKDGKLVYTYSMMPEYWYSANDMTLGVFCHELGHVFGLPDLYDTDYSSNGVGRWSVMSAGSWNGSLGSSPAHFDAWCRIQLGFASATNVSSTVYGAQIPEVESSGTVYRLWTNGALGNEYYLVENRQKTGYDSYLPGEGLLIWHIDDNVSDNDNEWYPGHTGSGHYAVALIQADNNWSLEQGFGSGDSGDPFPGSSSNNAFSPLTSPSSNDYSGTGSLVGITNISPSSDTMTADLFVSFASSSQFDEPSESLPESFSLKQNYPNPFNSETRIDYYLDRPGEVSIEIFNILGQTVLDITEHKETGGDYSFSWHGDNRSGEEAPAGVYFYRLTLDNQSQVRKMLFLK